MPINNKRAKEWGTSLFIVGLYFLLSTYLATTAMEIINDAHISTVLRELTQTTS
ncbi:hypothetical protein SAMN04488540_10178 [Ferrimonas sediminum]|uniref:Uncharacterized protein n=1 Tax=Ferrimonas sediminum TaxID=718193 RepID=A0A1G8JKG3_9GAMM|nr:hypothetical protein SAMN04488540_10178 [Ferrimonas sediminum]